MNTWKIVAIVGGCIVLMLAVVAVTLLAIDTEKNPTKEDLFISALHGKFPETASGEDQRLLKVARDTCAQLDAGTSIGQVIVNMGTEYTPEDFAGGYDVMVYAMAEGIRTICPQHVEQAKGFANGG